MHPILKFFPDARSTSPRSISPKTNRSIRDATMKVVEKKTSDAATVENVKQFVKQFK